MERSQNLHFDWKYTRFRRLLGVAALVCLWGWGVCWMGVPLRAESYGDGAIIAGDQAVDGVWGPGVLYLNQDVTILSGVRITIAPGTTVLAATSDARASGLDGARVELVVAAGATLSAHGPVTLASQGGAAGDWYGVRYAGSASAPGSRGELRDVTIRHAVHALILETLGPVTVTGGALRDNQHITTARGDAYGAGLVIRRGSPLISGTVIAANTIIATGSGRARGAGVYIAGGGPRLIGVRVSQNRAKSGGAAIGGGIAVSSGSAQIERAALLSNTLEGQVVSGGGIGFDGKTAVVVRGCEIAYNRVSSWVGMGGGGIGFTTQAGATLISGNQIVGNQVLGSNSEGGGIDAWQDNQFTATHNLIYNNTAAEGRGGGVFIHGAVYLLHNTIVSNTASYGGGVSRQASGFIFNNIIVGNLATAPGGGGGMFRHSADDFSWGTDQAGYNNVWNNHPDNNNYDNPAALPPDAIPDTDFQVDPQFVGSGDLVARYHLHMLSPMVDMGLPITGAADALSADYDGDARPQGRGLDLGFDEVPLPATSGVIAIKRAEPFLGLGEPLTYTLLLLNGGAVSQTVQLTDTLPAQTQYRSGPIFSHGNGGYVGGDILWQGILAPHSQTWVRYSVTINVAMPADAVTAGLAIVNAAVLRVGTLATATQILTTPPVTTLGYAPVLALSQESAIAKPVIGGPVGFRVRVRNFSNAGRATQVVLRTAVPPYAAFVDGGVLQGGAIYSTLPRVVAGGVEEVVVRLRTCSSTLTNADYRIVTSTQHVTSAAGPPLTLAVLTPPQITAGFQHTPYQMSSHPTTVNLDEPITFTAIGRTTGGPFAMQHWDFGDGIGAAGLMTGVVTHTYRAPGIYSVTLTLTDVCGFTGKALAQVQALAHNLHLVKAVTPTSAAPGAVLSYTLGLSNTGPGDALNLAVRDVLAPPLTYLLHSGALTFPLITTTLYRDEFRAARYDGSDGSGMWAGAWQEIADDGSPESGGVRIVEDLAGRRFPYDLSLRFQDGERQAQRHLALSGYTTAYLSFEYRRVRFATASDQAYVEVATDPGCTVWSRLETFSGPAEDTHYLPLADYEIPIAAAQGLCVRLSASLDNEAAFWLDNVQVRVVQRDMLTRPATPPTLADVLRLNAGERLTFTYAARLHPPLTGGLPITNQAFAQAGAGLPAVSVITATVESVAPVAASDYATVVWGSAVSVAVLVNDYDINGDQLSLAGVGQPTLGVVTRSGEHLRYTPTTGLSGADAFTYTLSDGALETSGAVTITVIPNHAPVFTSFPPLTATEDVSYTYWVTASDVDVGSVLRLSAPVLPTWLIFSGSAGSGELRGTPSKAALGIHAAALHVQDQFGAKAQQTFSITVLAHPNRAPQASGDAEAVDEDTALLLHPLTNDADPDADPLRLSAVGLAVHGQTAIISPTSLQYLPEANFFGTDVFTYAVSDGQLTAVGPITVTVAPVNDAPTLSSLPDARIPINSTLGPLTVLTADVDDATEALTLTALTSNAALLPPAAIVIGGAGTARTLALTPTAALTGFARITLTVSDGRAATASAFALEVYAEPVKPRPMYLPLVLRTYYPVVAPDLVIARLIATPDTVYLVIRNRGDAPAYEPFWVDVYIAPTPPPTACNQTWPMLASQGLVWAISRAALPLAPGRELTLTVEGAYYSAAYSQVTWPLAAGSPVYAQVDSAYLGIAYGAIREGHEITGGLYNNIYGPVVVGNPIRMNQASGRP